MTPDELREKVARAIYDILEEPIANQDFGRQQRQWEKSLMLAAAAIAVALEEAARALMAVERYDIDTDYGSLDKTPDGELMHAEDAFAAIRALISPDGARKPGKAPGQS